MAASENASEFHARQAKIAKDLYIAGANPPAEAQEWHSALRIARAQIAAALRASDYLRNISAALSSKGMHMLVFRSMTAPPISQDQFALFCPPWNKATEQPHRKVKAAIASVIAVELERRRDRLLTRWLNEDRRPSLPEIRRLFSTVAPLIASQQVSTAKRIRLAAEQESAVIQLLTNHNWKRLPSKMIDTKAALPPRHFMHKTRFATQTRHQEVDIACGLEGTVVLAMECKVTNDPTNSVKRINDVLKKANAWKQHWGNFVKPAALLQGVIKAEDVHRLLDADVRVFWSHDLSAFEHWLTENG